MFSLDDTPHENHQNDAKKENNDMLQIDGNDKNQLSLGTNCRFENENENRSNKFNVPPIIM